MRVVEATMAPWRLAMAAAASPTDVVPPRIRTCSPAATRRARNSDPHAVCIISGIAPSVSQGSAVLTGWTCLAGTQVYSA